ncbi:MAG: GNAT family N-acetyltransferase [Gammaproteobacteria bacterium]|jgi:ribosomal protein S18 acetylase RimI-like enzyme|nr:GNAT family N-acetyltransferase [Gammaproteobacteria bacterium]MBU0770974.1 GNAT family N-acetyltransferase [Gammaproteobacteria bacterium]MBU0856710.1 GNAT family N-acetyltransferase [Gammaproteobacteria bacterium]MBU1848077.1 GNAT family N-acetyltransferase [Gammaproteobacteria bacterium]
MIEIVASTDRLLHEVMDWLRREEEGSGEGFFCKRDMIAESHQNGELYCGVIKGTVVGFVMHSIVSVRGAIDILEVHPQHRRCHIGTNLAVNAIERLHLAGAESVRVQCRSGTSMQFWLSLGFVPQVTPNPQVYGPVHLVLFGLA